MGHKYREIEQTLLNKFGFTRCTTRGDDHRWVELCLPGLPTIRTKFSHSSREAGPNLESTIARQLHVRTAFFRAMIDCTKSREDYYRQVREAPFPPFSRR